MGSMRPWLLVFLLGCGAEGVDALGCVQAFDDADVCFDLAPADTCDGTSLHASCEDGGFSVPVESCSVRIAGTDGGFLEPGLCPAGEPGS